MKWLEFFHNISLTKTIPLSLALCFALSAHSAEKKPSPLVFESSLTTASNMYKWGTPESSLETAWEIAPSYTFEKQGLTLGGYTGLSRVHNVYEKNQVIDPRLTLRKSAWPIGKYLGFSPAIRGSVAANKDEIKRDSFIGYVALQPRLTFNLEKTNLKPFSQMTGWFQLSLSRNFHQYTNATTGKSNNQYGISPSFELIYSPIKPLSFTFDLSRSYKFTYLGHPNHGYQHTETLAYEFTNYLSVSIAHDLKGNVYKENGIDSAVSAFDSDQSTIGLGVGIRLD